MKLLIIGASGLIGGALFREAKNNNFDVIGTYFNNPTENLQRLDYGNKEELEKLFSNFKPEVIICPAANPNVDWIEQNPDLALENNVEKLNVLFKESADRNIPVAFFSTDYLFNGEKGPYSEEAEPNPINTYGKHKLAAEIALKAFLPENHFIFRTTWVFGYEKQKKNFLYSLLKSLSAKKEFTVPVDMFATPAYTNDIARFALEIVRKNAFGTYHLSNGDFISRYDFAKLIAQIFNLDEKLIIKSSFSEMKYFAKRPLLAGLKNEKSIKTTSLQWSKLENALKQVKSELESHGQFPIIENNLKSRICIFIPCYNATITLPKVFERIPQETKEKVEEIFVVDNDSSDYTYLMAIGYREKKSDIKNLKIFKNAQNFGYGGSQKIAYAYAIKQGYDMVVMLHGDAQYAPEKLPVMIEAMEKDKSIDLLFGSRMAGDPLKGGMPIHRFLGNKALTLFQNLLLGTKISEFHSGYRIFRTSALAKIPFHLCSNDYHFDTETIILFIKNKLKINEIPIDTYYGNEKNYVKIWQYGFNVLIATLAYFLYTKGVRKLFSIGLERYELYKVEEKANIEEIFKTFKTEIY